MNAGYSTGHFGKWHLGSVYAETPVRWELYNLADDPMETSNLSDSQKTKVLQMKLSLEKWLFSVIASLNGEDY